MGKILSNSLKVLEQTCAPRVLVLLLEEKKPLTISNLRRKITSSQDALYNALKLLHEYGLIKEEREENFPRRRLISLTDQGRKIAELLVEIEKVLEG